MKLCIILGTRPEIIKLSPIIRECVRRGLDFFVIHTGQHYSYLMDAVFFKDLQLPVPKYSLDVGSGSHGRQTAKMIGGIEEVLEVEKPDIVYVQGDTNTVLAGALAASKLHIRIGHIEAGLRSLDRDMPEEINRIIADHVSDLLFTPTEKSKALLLKEGIPENRVFTTGNTIVDAIYENQKIARSSNILSELLLEAKRYMLSTLHRPENVDNQSRLAQIIQGLGLVSREYSMPIVFPLHPRTKKMIEQFGIDIPPGIRVIEPLGFMDFIKIEANAALVFTDSGGVQEECCILGVPCVTLRENTERPETIDVGANILAGYHTNDILSSARKMMKNRVSWQNPFGDGNSAKYIINLSMANSS